MLYNLLDIKKSSIKNKNSAVTFLFYLISIIGKEGLYVYTD